VLTFHVILAVVGVAALIVRPRSFRSALVSSIAAGVDVALGARLAPTVTAVGPLLVFLCAALTLAALAERSGLAARAAYVLARAARGSALVLYGLVCTLCTLLTWVVTLDGSVVLTVPVLLVLARRWAAPFAPLFVGVVVVANAASIAVPQGNPTNLVIIQRLGLSPETFLTRMFAPGLAATLLCAGVVALWQRRVLAGGYRPPELKPEPAPEPEPEPEPGPVVRRALSGAERGAALWLGAAAVAAWTAPLVGVAPWWPFAGVVAAAIAVDRTRSGRTRLVVPWRIVVQVGALVTLLAPLGLHGSADQVRGLGGLAAVALGVGAASALANNLPVSVWAATLLAGAAGYAAAIGLAVGSLAAPQGSVATLIAVDLAGSHAPRLRVRQLAPLATAAVLVASLVLAASQ